MNEAVKSIFSIIQYGLCLHGILQLKFVKNKVGLIAAGVLLAVFLSCEGIGVLGENAIAYAVVVYAVATCLAFEGKWGHNFLKFGDVFFGMEFISLPIHVTIQIIQRYHKSGWLSRYEEWVTEITLTIVIIVILYLLHCVGAWRNIVRETGVQTYVIILIISFCTGYFSSTVLSYGEELAEHVRTLFEITGLCLTEGIGLLGIGVIAFKRLKERYQQESTMKSQYMEESQYYYQTLCEKMEEIRKIRHDMKANLETVNGLLKQGSISEATDYLDHVTEVTQNAALPMVDVGNEFVNAVLSGEKMKMPENTVFQCEGSIPVETALDHYELCTVFANLVSNAREACERIKQHPREISLKIKQNRGHMVVEIKNPLEWKVDTERFNAYASGKNENRRKAKEIPDNHAGYTTKEDVKNHGYGLQNVCEVVNKHHGTIRFEVTEGKFVVKLLI